MIAIDKSSKNRRLSKTDLTRLRFVTAIRSELATTGGFNAQSVAQRAETSQATYYNHFKSKDLALASAFEAVMDELQEVVEQGLKIDLLLQEGLADFCANWSQTCADFFSTNSIVLMVAQATAPTSADLRQIFTKRRDESLSRYEQFVELGQLAQVVRPGDTRAIAKLLLITNQNWNHPFLYQAQASDALYQEMTQAMVQLLTPQNAAP